MQINYSAGQESGLKPRNCIRSVARVGRDLTGVNI